jgi:hypothetical protein
MNYLYLDSYKANLGNRINQERRFAPWSRMKVSANLSRYKVVTPSLTSPANIPNVLIQSGHFRALILFLHVILR